VLIATERDAKPVGDLLRELEQKHGETEVVISSITVIELEHGLHRANTPALARHRRAYLESYRTFFGQRVTPETLKKAPVSR
jgi:predicted nucleic acid-binding protein